ncbi:hypothetical protein [Actinopolymorpha pittospori]
MRALVGAVVLAWLALVLLTFAMAGLLRQLRDVQRSLLRARSDGVTTARRAPQEIPASLRPQGSARHTVVLLVDNDCPICAEVAPVFADLAALGVPGADFVVLGRGPGEKFESLPHCRYVVDAAACQLLDPGWRPALIVVDTDGKVVLAEPAGSEESVRFLVADVARRTPRGLIQSEQPTQSDAELSSDQVR